MSCASREAFLEMFHRCSKSCLDTIIYQSCKIEIADFLFTTTVVPNDVQAVT